MTGMMVPERRVAFSGPKGVLVRQTLLDTGASQAALPEADAERLGIRTQYTEPVHTDGGVVSWGVGEANISLDGETWHKVDLWIVPPQDPAPPTLGWAALTRVGFNLTPPSRATTYPEVLEE
jgi:predicted aspartyl protease